MPFLFDASALLNMIISRGQRALGIVKGQHILDLTLYEAGNALWKLSAVQKRLTVEEVNSLLGVMTQLTKRTRQIGVAEIDLVSVMGVARTEKMTFYDAAYLTVARDRRLLLVTDDKGLSKLASKYVEVKGSSEL